jgi:hypothetical protein
MSLDRQCYDAFGRFLKVSHGNAPWPPVAVHYLRDLKMKKE